MLQFTFNTKKTTDTIHCHMIQINDKGSIVVTGSHADPKQYFHDEDIVPDKDIDDSFTILNHKYLRIKNY